MFWREMECSGVSNLKGSVSGKGWGEDEEEAYMGVPSWGLRKRTPSSVTFASLRRLTIWKLLVVEGKR